VAEVCVSFLRVSILIQGQYSELEAEVIKSYNLIFLISEKYVLTAIHRP
jgi:hypothetical protein